MNINFSDIFKSSFLEKTTSFSLVDSLLAIVVAFTIGYFIYIIYKKTFTGVLYSHTFNISLLAMTMVTAMIIMGVSTNVVLSLGMVGALSIVRFRTAIKDPMDTFYIFWSIAAGILCGAGLLPLAIIGSILVGLMLILLVNRITVENPYLLIVKYSDSGVENAVLNILNAESQKYSIKSKTINGEDDSEMIFEIRLKGSKTSFVNDISRMSGVQSAAMLSYDGNFAS